MKKHFITILIAAALLITNFNILARDKEDAKELVSKSLSTLDDFANDPDMKWFRNNIKNAKGILIVPNLLKAGFIFGGTAGSGVLLRNNATGKKFGGSGISWSYPAFYSLGSVTWGLQIGGEAAEVVMLVMNDRGMDALLTTKVQLGAGVSIAAGPVGAGTQAATADIYQFSRSKGLYGGLTLEGGIINPRNEQGSEYYGKTVSPMDILVKGQARNAQAYNLRAKLAALSK